MKFWIACAFLAVSLSPVAAADVPQEDVYALTDPAARLAALQRRWADDTARVGVWDLPDHADGFDELDRLQEWCEEKIEERAQTFLSVAEEGVRLRIEPAVWHYNAACALARLKRADEAFAALEKAVASGYYDAGHACADADLENLRADARFAKLTETMRAAPKPHYNQVAEAARVESGEIRLSERNVQYALRDRFFHAEVPGLSAKKAPVALLVGDAALACGQEGVVPVVFPEQAQEKGVGRICPDFYAWGGDDLPLPVLFANADRVCDGEDGDATSVPGQLALRGARARGMFLLTLRSCLGVLSCASDYRVGGEDRLLGFAPVGLFYAGTNAAPFVEAALTALRALPASVRCDAVAEGRLVDTLLSVLMADRWRPCLVPEDLDLDAIRARAARVAAPVPSRPALAEAEVLTRHVPVTDMQGTAYDEPAPAVSPVYRGYRFAGAARTITLRVRVKDLDDGAAQGAAPSTRFVWKVLQGAPGKVRVRPSADGSEAEIEVDHHEPFRVVLPQGGEVVSTRVDVGCFCERGGVLGAPSVISVHCSPNETRTYGPDGRLRAIDYARPRFGGWRTRHCVRGDWRDEFSYLPDGTLLGWTRTRTVAEEGVVTNAFTREGLEVVSRDARGRPADTRRNFRSLAIQEMDVFATTGGVFAASMQRILQNLEEIDEPPSGFSTAWRYAYADDGDRLGEASPVPCRGLADVVVPCRRAVLGEAGFELPLQSRVKHLYRRFAEVGVFGLHEDFVDRMRRMDNSPGSRKRGLEKMRFCAMSRGVFGWKGTEEFEELLARLVLVQGDGAIRLTVPGDDEEGAEKRWQPIGNSLRLVEGLSEMLAYRMLDAAYARCPAADVRAVFHAYLSEPQWKDCLVLEGDATPPDGEGEEQPTFAAWKIAGNVYMAVGCSFSDRHQSRTFLIARTPGGEPSAFISLAQMEFLPTPAVAEAALGAIRGDAAALNNWAVLRYADVVDRQRYDEKGVLDDLMRSAVQGNVVAMRNLAVLHRNSGEPEKAARCLKAARLREQELLGPAGD